MNERALHIAPVSNNDCCPFLLPVPLCIIEHYFDLFAGTDIYLGTY